MILIKGDLVEGELAPGAHAVVASGTRGSSRPELGEIAFVWTTEMHGGEGLVAFGAVTGLHETMRANARTPGEHSEYDIDLRVEATARQPLTKADLAPYRDEGQGTVMGELAHNLYRQSHRKVFRLSEPTASHLRDYFERVR